MYTFVQKKGNHKLEICCTMGNFHNFFIFLNCPLAKNEVLHFTIDNNYFPFTYRRARYINLIFTTISEPKQGGHLTVQ